MAQATAIQKQERTPLAAEPVQSGLSYVPLVDIIECDDELLLVADVPGARAEDIDIQYERGLLTIHARVQPREPRNVTWLLREYGTGDFYRSFEIGEGIDADKIHAEVSDGVLRLHLPKTAEVRPRRIPVRNAR